MAEQEKQFAIQKIYTKDISFETPNSPQVFVDAWNPSVEFNLSTNVQQLEENLAEVAIKLTITVKSGEVVAYLVEVTQAGIFVLGGFTEQEMSGMVGSFCPNILFPYAREVVSDLVAKGGFPQFILAPVNFDALYAQHSQEQASNAPSSESIN
ncbi:protein-export protein SecB [Methylococcaceae bacterium]|jgi:preprotein translocase subunit SecB|nr:protein-export chaperone SecB [Methylococcales bacterium]GDX86002.1 protein-export protein SecB [Methylococcaceae bacterium]